jgi:hypothetical protein
VREIRMLRAMWRALETESRSFLNGHEGGNAGYSQGTSYGFTRQRSTLPPSSIAIDPSGKFAYVTNSDSNSVSMYSIDAATGNLMLIGLLDPGARHSYEQIDFGEANVQLTFHENDEPPKGTNWVLVEPDIDDFRGMAAHTLWPWCGKEITEETLVDWE